MNRSESGKRGGRPRKQRVVPPASAASPARVVGSPNPGRPTKCTPEVIERFAKFYGRGVGIEDAARAMKLDPQTAHEWFARGEKGEEPYRTFAEKAQEAEAQAIISAAEEGRKQRPLEFLARVRRQRWGPDVLESAGDARVIVVMRSGFAGHVDGERRGAVIELPPAREAGELP